MFASGKFRLFAIFLSLLTALSVVTIDTAEARRGGSFGSRGTRTFQTVPATNTSPKATAPVNNTMTAPTAASRNGVNTPISQRPGGLFGGGLLQGLFLGGLFGLFLGHGFGGFGGVLSLLFQILLVAGLVWFFFGRRRFAAAGGAPAGAGPGGYDRPQANPFSGGERADGQRAGQQAGGQRADGKLEVSNRDLDLFEQRLHEVQSAYSHEDYAKLRAITTPEMMGYLSEELGANASKGVRNEVFDVKMLGGSVAEAWREGSRDYVSVAMRYESRDVTRERATGQVVSGSEDVSETTEVWTFVRENGGEWKLSAIQEA
jgi:predicted lipid-binding transport protein (Tim44 family)